MTFIDSVKTCFKKYIDFNGRASRSEYWWFTLFIILFSTITQTITNQLSLPLMLNVSLGHGTGMPLFNYLWFLVFIPSLAVSVRRLHDIDKSGWNVLWNLIPIINFILLIVWYCQKGTKGSNQFGENSL